MSGRYFTRFPGLQLEGFAEGIIRSEEAEGETGGEGPFFPTPPSDSASYLGEMIPGGKPVWQPQSRGEYLQKNKHWPRNTKKKIRPMSWRIYFNPTSNQSDLLTQKQGTDWHLHSRLGTRYRNKFTYTYYWVITVHFPGSLYNTLRELNYKSKMPSKSCLSNYKGNTQLQLGKMKEQIDSYPHGSKFIVGPELPVVQDRFNEIYVMLC